MQVDDTTVPGRELDADISQSGGPFADGGESVEGRLVAQELGEEYGGAFYGLHIMIILFGRGVKDGVVGPFFQAFVAPDKIVDKGHAPDAVFDAGEVGGFFGRGGVIQAGGECQSEIAVDVGECFEIAFGVSAGCACVVFGKGGEPGHSGAVGLGGLIEPFYKQGIGFLLGPFDSAFFTVDADGECIFLAGSDL